MSGMVVFGFGNRVPCFTFSREPVAQWRKHHPSQLINLRPNCKGIKHDLKLSKSRDKNRIKLKRKQCLLLLLPVELFIKIANELSFRQMLTLALNTDYFGFMFMLTEIWSMSITNLVLENVEIKSSSFPTWH
jgi:hypothetical protein